MTRLTNMDKAERREKAKQSWLNLGRHNGAESQPQELSPADGYVVLSAEALETVVNALEDAKVEMTDMFHTCGGTNTVMALNGVDEALALLEEKIKPRTVLPDLLTVETALDRVWSSSNLAGETETDA